MGTTPSLPKHSRRPRQDGDVHRTNAQHREYANRRNEADLVASVLDPLIGDRVTHDIFFRRYGIRAPARFETTGARVDRSNSNPNSRLRGGGRDRELRSVAAAARASEREELPPIDGVDGVASALVDAVKEAAASETFRGIAVSFRDLTRAREAISCTGNAERIAEHAALMGLGTDLGMSPLTDSLTATFNEVLAADMAPTPEIVNQFQTLANFLAEEFAPALSRLCAVLTHKELDREEATSRVVELRATIAQMETITGRVGDENGLLQLVKEAAAEQEAARPSGFEVQLAKDAFRLCLKLAVYVGDLDSFDYLGQYKIVETGLTQWPATQLWLKRLARPSGTVQDFGIAGAGASPGLIACAYGHVYVDGILPTMVRTGLTTAITYAIGLVATPYVVALVTPLVSILLHVFWKSLVVPFMTHLFLTTAKFSMGCAKRAGTAALRALQSRGQTGAKNPKRLSQAWVCNPDSSDRHGRCRPTQVLTSKMGKDWRRVSKLDRYHFATRGECARACKSEHDKRKRAAGRAKWRENVESALSQSLADVGVFPLDNS
jgi:hypothetical protein